MECHLTGTKAGRGARWKGCAFTRLLWNCAGRVLLRRWPVMLLLSALSAKDFAEAIVGFLCGLFEEEGRSGCCYLEQTTRLDGGPPMLRMPTFVIKHQARAAPDAALALRFEVLTRCIDPQCHNVSIIVCDQRWMK